MKKNLLALAAVAVFALISWRGILFAPGHVYQNWDNVTPPFPEEVRRLAAISKYAWNPLFDLGSPGAFGAIDRWFDIAVRDASAPLGGTVLAKWQGPAYAVVAAGGILALAKLLSLSFLPALVAALLYAANPRLYSLAVSGHLQESGLALVVLPWALFLLAKAASVASRRRAVAAAMGAGLIGGLACSASPMGIVFTGSLLALFTLAQTVFLGSRRPLAALSLCLGVIVVLHLYWLVPAGLSMVRGEAAVKYHQSAGDVAANYRGMYKNFSTPPRLAAVGHTDNYGMGTEYAYPVSSKDNPVWFAAAWFLLGLALLGLTFRAKARGVKVFAALSLLAGFVLFAGSHTVFGAVFYEKALARVPMVFFLMARPARWLPLYFTGLALLAGMGLQAVYARGVWRPSRLLDAAVSLLVLAALAVYLAPYWTGALTQPRNATTQTMALMPQPVSPAEAALVQGLSSDPEDYRVTVWPTIAGPTGAVPAPPDNAVTRNFALLGKDAVLGPTFIGEPYTHFLLNVLYRPWPYTDAFGKLLGLAAVKRVIYDPSVPYLAYNDFGWMPTTKRGPETLFDPDGILAAFTAAQRDLAPDKDLAAPPLAVLANVDFQPRVRLATHGALAAGGLPLLLTMASLPGDRLADAALFMASDLTLGDISRLSAGLSGAVVGGRSWPELLLPDLPPDAFVPAAKAEAEGEFSPLSSRSLADPRFDGGRLDAGGRVSRGPGTLRFALVGHGAYRLFARLGAEPYVGDVHIAFDGRELAAVTPGPGGRGLDWLDLGVVEGEPGPPQAVSIAVSGRGAVVSGLLAVPEETFEAAKAGLALRLGGKLTLVAEAEAAAGRSAGRLAPQMTVPLLAAGAPVAVASANVRIERADPMGAGLVAAEGDAAGEVAFTAVFPEPVTGFTLEAYPRLFGDKASPSFVEAAYSCDGSDFIPLGRIEGVPDGRWEDVYGRKFVKHLTAKAKSVTVRFRLRQAQLSSQVNPPNAPMRLVVDTPLPGKAVLSFGAGVRLPAAFGFALPGPGTWQAKARVVGRAGDTVTPEGGVPVALDADGAAWIEAGMVTTNSGGKAGLRLDGPSSAGCDVIVLEPISATEPTGTTAEAGPPPMAYERQNASRYRLDIPEGQGGYVLFSEAYHPDWRLRLQDAWQRPIEAYGFANAYPIPKGASGPGELVFALEPVMERWLAVSEAGWVVFALAIVALSLPTPRRSRR